MKILLSESTGSVQQSECNASAAAACEVCWVGSHLLQLISFNYLGYTYPKQSLEVLGVLGEH